MSFTLHLSFGGLCLFVPEYNGDRVSRMRVLLPTCAEDTHLPALIYDKAALTQGAQPKRERGLTNLPNSEIDLSPSTFGRPLEPPPHELANLTTLFGARVPRDLLTEKDTAGRVNARISFASGRSRIPRCGSGGIWFFPYPPKPQTPLVATPQLPIRVIWTLEIDGASLVVPITGINDSMAMQTLTFYPFEGHLDLWIFNSPELPETIPPLNKTDEPDPLKPATHFACYYMLTDRDKERRVPLFHHPPSLAQECFPAVKEPGLDLTCIGAQALPQTP